MLDGAKIFAAPDDPADWPALARGARALARRGAGADRLRRRRVRAAGVSRGRSAASRSRSSGSGTSGSTTTRRSASRPSASSPTPSAFGGFDGDRALARVPGDRHRRAQPVRLVPRRARAARARRGLRARGVRVFVDYNPWDVGTRREPVGDAEAVGEIVARLGRRRRLPRHDEGGACRELRDARRPGVGASRASRRCRSRASPTTISRGRSGSPTRACRA